jgi:hypothetical protein
MFTLETARMDTAAIVVTTLFKIAKHVSHLEQLKEKG